MSLVILEGTGCDWFDDEYDIRYVVLSCCHVVVLPAVADPGKNE
jgi:hypothetical protein